MDGYSAVGPKGQQMVRGRPRTAFACVSGGCAWACLRGCAGVHEGCARGGYAESVHEVVR
eukprot:1194700-Rhodomonas_salina.1